MVKKLSSFEKLQRGCLELIKKRQEEIIRNKPINKLIRKITGIYKRIGTNTIGRNKHS